MPLLLALLALQNSPPIEIGTKLTTSGSLRDLRGNQRQLADFKDARAFVLVFLGAECPLSNLYTPRLVELEKKYRGEKVKILGLYPNEPETIDRIAAHGDDYELPFLLLKDFGQQIADAVGVTRTPGVALLDAGLVLRYRGRIDDQYSAASRKESPTSKELVDAIDALLAGKPVAVPQAAADGCLLARGLPAPPERDVTFSRDVAPILQKRCQDCHRKGGIGPFELDTFEQAAGRKAMLREVVVQRRMPPWHADARYGKFSNDRSLSEAEIGTIRRWVDTGAPRGSGADLPPPIARPEGWSIGTPDAIVKMPNEIDVPAQGKMDYLYFTTPTGFGEDRWVQQAEVRPGDATVVHHVLVYVKMKGKPMYQADGASAVVVGWAPGDMPSRFATGTALKIPKEADLLWEVHYTPTGKATKDRTSVGLIFAKEPPPREVQINIMAEWNLRIPAGDPSHRRVHSFHFKEDVRILSLMPHMHVRGKSWKYELVAPDGQTTTILSVPRWDFAWQSVYRFAEPLRVAKGSRLRAVVHFDNSDNNPLNPDPTKVVRYGLQTWEEMMNGWVTYVKEEPQ